MSQLKIKHVSQSIMEYLLFLGAIVTLIIIATVGFTDQGGALKRGLRSGLTEAQGFAQGSLGLNYSGEVVDLANQPEYANDPDLIENLNYQDPVNNQYYFQEGENTHIGGIPVEEIPQGGSIVPSEVENQS